mgnify:FL=1
MGQMRVDANVSIRPNNNQIKSNDERIILKDESYRLMGLLFEIHNKLGSVYKEKNYQDAIEAILEREKIPFEREKNITLKFDNLDVSDFFADFIIDNKIILEIKATQFITQEDIRQILRYIKSANLPLGIIVNFRSGELEYKRVINPKFDNNSVALDNNSGDIPLGTRTEIKNLNSFSAIEAAINYEIKRQTEVLDSGKKVVQETLGWDDMAKKTISQRSKEEAHDYRYFPEPDIPPFDKSGFEIDKFRAEIPELPNQKRERFKKMFYLNNEQANIIVEDRKEAAYFEEAVSELEDESQENINQQKTLLIYNYLNSDIKGLLKYRDLDFDKLKITPENLADLVEMIAKKEINSRTAKDLLVRMFESGEDPREIVKQEGLGQISETGDLEIVAGKILEANPQAVADYKKGKLNALQFLVGKTMAELKGRGNPEALKKIFEEKLKT